MTPGDLVLRHTALLEEWDRAKCAAWEARVAKLPAEEINRLEALVWDRATDVEVFERQLADDFALTLRIVADQFPHLDIARIRSDLNELADATLGQKRGAA